jgi:hypothetical protein
MRVFLVMGTHLPEIRQCVNHLSGAEETAGAIEFHVPAGLDWQPEAGQRAQLKPYDPEKAAWVFDPDGADTVFILLDPRLNPVDQLECLAEDLRKCLIEPVKILTCVDCEVVEREARAKSYYEACIYYSDVALLGNRAKVAKSFTRDYQKQFERSCFPCLFMFLKGPGNPDDAVEILTPGTRRITQLFDVREAHPEPELPGMVIEASCDLDLEEEEADPYRNPLDPASGTAPIPDVSDLVVTT